MKKNIQTGIVTLAVAGLSFAGVAFAMDTAMTGDAMMHKDAMSGSMMNHPAPMVLEINKNGQGRLRGVVASVSAASITVSGWGGVWTVNTTAGTTFSGATSIADIKVGDFVGVMGTFAKEGWMVNATIVRDWNGTSGSMMKHDAMMKSGDSMMKKDDAMMKKDSMVGGDHMMASSTGSMTH